MYPIKHCDMKALRPSASGESGDVEGIQLSGWFQTMTPAHPRTDMQAPALAIVQESSIYCLMSDSDWWQKLPPGRSRNWIVILLGGCGQDVFNKLDNGFDVGVFI
ncbi:hypothetical protein BDR07DRAFT_1459057 [Suillus spraguei]|nr:hypothetical protein BDR07DRAFT_1459057 [Suillus spraguei]